MASHSRARSKGSFPVFSIDTFRSFSRTGSRAASQARRTEDPEKLTRSPSSISRCDPLAQLPPSPAGIHPGQSPSRCCESPYNDPIHEPRDDSSTSIPTNPHSLMLNASKRARPFSWMLLRAPTKSLKKRSLSVQLPKDVSSSTMARSVISAPVLTSTTNARVAETEGVNYEELTQDAFSKSTRCPRLGWIKTDPSTADEARTLAEKISREQKNVEKPRRRLHRLSDALKNKLRRTESLQAEDGSSLNHKIARRKAETFNLCKEKIKDITGNGLVRRKSIDPKPDQRSVDDPPLLNETSESFSLSEDHGSQYGSLSRSFNSALEKLDIAATTNMSFLRSKSSLFNMRKENAPLPVAITPTPHATAARCSKRKELPKHSSPQNTMETDEQGRNIKQYHYSPNKGGYIPAPPFHGRPAGVNPLRMHTDAAAFAQSPSQTPGLNPTQSHDGLLEVADGCSLDEAPIYSPSVGDLSQYSNSNTISPKPVAHRAITPTKTSKVRALKKSKSGLGLLSTTAVGWWDENQSLRKSRSMTLNPFRKENPPQMTNVKESPYKPITPSPLRNEAKLLKGRSARSGLSPRSPQDQAKRYGIIGVPSLGKSNA